MLPPIVFWTLLFVVCAAAAWRGRTDERVAAGACAIATLATHFILGPLRIKYSSVEPGLLALDLAMLATFVTLALRSLRSWPLWVAGLLLTMSRAHFLKAIDSDLMPRAYAAAAVFWSYPILFIILVASWRTRRYEKLDRRSATLVQY
jgi:predicted branched-subunit amino acid permease